MSYYKYGRDKDEWHITIYFKKINKEQLIKKFIIALNDVIMQSKINKVIEKFLNKIPIVKQ